MNYENTRRQYKTEWERKKRQKIKSFSSPHNEFPDISENNAGISIEPPSHLTDVETPVITTPIGNTSVSQSHGQMVDSGMFTWKCIDEHETQDDSDSEFDELHEGSCLSEKLRDWVNTYNVKHNAVDGLLKIWRDEGHTQLPKTARGLLKTSVDMNIQQVSGMAYTYLGLENAIRANFLRYSEKVQDQVSHLEIGMNIDGLPIFKSTNDSLWPILVGIVNIEPPVVFPVAFSFGKSKPSDLEFLKETVFDLDSILKNGLKINAQKHLTVSLRCIVCDAPAKAMVKGVKLVSGYYGCDRCEVKGIWDGKVIYDETRNLPLRTNQRFRNRANPQHHKFDTPFTKIESLNMISHFPIDYMHLLCLGVMKRLILLWLRGPRSVRLCQGQINIMNDRMSAFKKYIPNCFARKPRSFSEIDRWKATEFRQFLLYTGKFILKGILPENQYQHFITLNVAISILLGEKKDQDCYEYANSLLVYFVEEAKLIYEQGILVYNVHGLLHLVEDARLFGSLDNHSAFLYESYMQTIKRSVRSGKNVLAQIVRRTQENQQSTIPSLNDHNLIFKRPNNAYFLQDGSFGEIIRINGSNTGEEKIVTRVYNKTNSAPLFTDPCDSRDLGISVFLETQVEIQCRTRSCLKRQAIMKTCERKVTFMSLLHNYHHKGM